MLIKFGKLLSFILIWIILMGVPNDVFAICTLISCVTITYYIASYLSILPKKTIFNRFGVYYFFWLILEIIKSSVNVIKVIWSIKAKINTEFEWIEAEKDEIALMLYANSITLTPGTITADVKNNMLLVHALEKSSLEDLKKGRIYSKILSVIGNS